MGDELDETRRDLRRAFDLALELKTLDRETYGEIFAWVNRSVKTNMPVSKVLKVIEIARSRAGEGQRPRDLYQYMGGIARSLEGEKAAAELRAGQANYISDILGRAMAAAKKKT